MRDLVSDRELQGVVFVLADQVEKTPADVDVTTGMRECVHFVAVQDRVLVGDVLPLQSRQKRPGGVDNSAQPRAAFTTGLSSRIKS